MGTDDSFPISFLLSLFIHFFLLYFYFVLSFYPNFSLFSLHTLTTNVLSTLLHSIRHFQFFHTFTCVFYLFRNLERLLKSITSVVSRLFILVASSYLSIVLPVTFSQSFKLSSLVIVITLFLRTYFIFCFDFSLDC